MLIAYIDEFGHSGPYISSTHEKFNHHPVFGYAGFILPAKNARAFSARFKHERDTLFRTVIESSDSPHQFEKKGNEYFSTGSISANPSYVRVFRSLLRRLYQVEGQLFYYGDEKPLGTVKQTGIASNETAQNALQETINRICRYAHRVDQDVLIIADAITDKTRREMVAQMYAHIYSRSTWSDEMKRIVEAPLHIESTLNTNVQFADWICALMARASHYQLVRLSEFEWAPRLFSENVRGHFTYESKLFTRQNEVDINHSQLFQESRARFPAHKIGTLGGQNPSLQEFYDTLRGGSKSSH